MNQLCCKHIFGVAINTTTTLFRTKKYWFRKCYLCRSRRMFSSMVRCIECKVLVHKNCISWENYFEQETQIDQCCPTVDTVDVVTYNEVEIIPSLVNVAINTDLIIDDSCSSVKVANITEVTNDHEMTPKVIVKKYSDIPFVGQDDELAKNTEDTKTTELKTDDEIIAETDESRMNDMKLAVTGVDAATMVANELNLASTAVMQNDGAISSIIVVRDSAKAVFIQDDESIPTTVVEQDSAITVTGQYNEPTNTEVTHTMEVPKDLKETKIIASNTYSEVFAESDEASTNEIKLYATGVDAATVDANVINLVSAVVLQNDGSTSLNSIKRDSAIAIFMQENQAIPTNIVDKYSAIAYLGQDGEFKNSKDTNMVEISRNIQDTITTEMNTNSELTAITDETSISEINHAVMDVEAATSAVVEKDSITENPLMCDEPFTESNSSLDNTSNVITVMTPQHEAILRSSEDTDGEIIPNVLSIISNQTQMNQAIYCSPTAPDVNTHLVELEEYDFEDFDRNPTDKEKITFIMNNLLAENVQKKCDEINRILRQEYVQWFSGYLIEERICYEFNRHELYSELLDRMGNEDLNALVLLKTTDKIQKLLNNDMRNSKPVLNNLGHWLGIITLAKNKPIPFHNSFLYSLLMRPYMKNDHKRLMFIIPFAAKILLSCAKSQDFGLKSHWTINILEILAKLHQLPDLKLNLQFEIEVLYKSLNIKLSDFYN